MQQNFLSLLFSGLMERATVDSYSGFGRAFLLNFLNVTIINNTATVYFTIPDKPGAQAQIFVEVDPVLDVYAITLVSYLLSSPH